MHFCMHTIMKFFNNLSVYITTMTLYTMMCMSMSRLKPGNDWHKVCMDVDTKSY